MVTSPQGLYVCGMYLLRTSTYTGIAFSLKRHFASSFFGGHTGADP